MSQRTAQIEAAIERVLARAIPELSDPRLPLIVTIERVQITPDLLHAKVFISSLDDVAPVVEALNHAKGFLQRQIAHEIRLKRTPLLEFLSAASPFRYS
ncbi:MAG: 30S ribosome-binding factor RbfA [Deinococcales bacterium]